MTRPATLKIGATSYWTIMTYTDAGVLVDADSTPTVAVRKNGVANADVVTVTKRATTTGIYDAYYNPAGEAEGDCFTLEETATISAQAYENAWNMEVLAVERGTDSANTVAPLDASATENAVWDAVVSSHATNGTFGDSLLVAQGSHREVSVDSNHNVHASVHAMEANVVDANSLAASAVTEIQLGLITTGTAFTHTNQAGDTMTVTIT